MKKTSQSRNWVIWLVILALAVILPLDIYTYIHQNSFHLNEDRRSDSKVLAQALRSLLRDKPTVDHEWPEMFVLGDGSGFFYCRALDREIPIINLAPTLKPYIRLMPRDQAINISHVSLYYVRRQNTLWSVGSCVLNKIDESSV